MNNNNIHQQHDSFENKPESIKSHSLAHNNIKHEPEQDNREMHLHRVSQDSIENNQEGPGEKNFSTEINMSASIKAYADRMQADYFRYRLAKESADNFYNRLAAVQNTFNHFRNYFNPFMLRSFGLAPGAGSDHPGVDMCLKPLPHSQPRNFVPNLSLPMPYPMNFQDGSKKRSMPADESDNDQTEKKPKLLSKRKPGKKSSGLNDETSSPVSGTVIRQLGEGEAAPEIRKGIHSFFVSLKTWNITNIYNAGDIDPEFNVVEVTEEAKQELAKIENKIGDYICRLCKEVYDDAFGLAQHR